MRYNAWHKRADGGELPVEVTLRPHRMSQENVVLMSARDDILGTIRRSLGVTGNERPRLTAVDERIAAVIARSRPRTLAEMDARSLPIRLRDGIARLFSPYL